MTLRRMEYFLALVEEGSFSRAATRLNVTQPALSQQMKALEDEVGALLVERLGRGVRITAAGRAYLPHVHMTLASYRRAGRAVQGVTTGHAGEIELASVISVGVGVLLKPLLRWHIEWPSVSVRLAEFSHRRALEEFAAAGGADVAVGPTPTSWEGECVALGRERFVIILPRDDPAAREVRPYAGRAPRAAARSIGTLPLMALQTRQWVLFDRANGLSEIVDTHLISAGLTAPRASLRTSQFVMAATLASSGMGPTLIPANVVPADVRGVICEPDPPLLRSLSAYSRNSLDGFPGHFVNLILQHGTMLELPEEKLGVSGMGVAPPL